MIGGGPGPGAETTRRALVLIHAESEGPIRLAGLLAARGLACELVDLTRGAEVPDLPDDGSPLIVMGGPMGVSDLGDARWPFLAAEVTLLRHALAVDHPVLGICLGAQLLAHAAGAQVGPNLRADGIRAYEVGWFPVRFATASGEPTLRGLPDQESFLHWHGDAFALPPGAIHLASSVLTPCQAFRLGRRAFGVQFHPEVDAPTIAGWVRDDLDYVRCATGQADGVALIADTERLMPQQLAVAERLMGNVLDAMLDTG